MQYADSIFWFRRDLRLDDNAALYHALHQNRGVQPIFIFDTHILSELDNAKDARVSYIYRALDNLERELRVLGSSIKIYYGTPEEVFEDKVPKDFPEIGRVYTNEDYEPYAILRDKKVAQLLSKSNITFNAFKDHVIFEKDEVLKQDGDPYTVFTPYANKWKEKLNTFYLKSYPTEKYFGNFTAIRHKFPSIEDVGFELVSTPLQTANLDASFFNAYKEKRDYPAQDGTSKVSVKLRFGVISIRKLASKAVNKGGTAFLNELIWRDFYQMILWHHPHVVKRSFKPKYDQIPWRNNEEEFEVWCKGKTGIPLVDAGMRELNETGYMHNRVRMVVASFLTKNLLIDWRWGEAYFAEKLMDFELASNNGGWQWAAGSGCDAAPYFRVFNPETQAKKFDPDGRYIRKWIPELDSLEYPQPMVDLKASRQRAIDTYKAALG